MLLVDTKLFPGAISEVPLDGNTLVTGTNAAGKTSIIQLIPLFFGVSPSKISKKNQGKNFYGHYLPRSTSYVAFEYRHRDGGARSVIIHAATSDDKPMFRFVRSPLYENMLVNDEGEFVASVDLASHLRNRGYQVADRIIDTLSDYQTIIQGQRIKGAKSKDQQFLAQMVSQYAASQLRHPLMNMDRVVYSMLKKDVSLQALEEMIAEKILQDESEIQIESDRQNLETWPVRYKAYQSVMKEEDSTRLLERRCIELDGHKATSAAALSELATLQSIRKAEKSEAEQREREAKRTLDKESEAYQDRMEEAHRATMDALASRNNLGDQIKTIESRHDEEKSAGIDGKLDLADRKSQIESDLSQTQNRLSALTGKHENISRQFDDMKRQAKDAASIEVETTREHDATDQAHHKSATAEATARHTRVEAELQDAHEEPISNAEDLRSQCLSEVGAAQEALKAPQASQEVVERYEEAHQALTEASAKFTASLQTEKEIEEAVRQRTDALNEIERGISAFEIRVADQRDELERLEASKKPLPGSLLAYLRESREGWADDIGRAINPDLLYRTDLDPTEISPASSVFGLSLNLDGVDPVAEADLSEIDNAIAVVKAEIDELEDEIARKRSNQTKAAEDRSKARADLSKHQGAQSVLDRHREAAHAALQSRRSELDLERRMAAEKAKVRLNAANAGLSAADQQKRDAVKARDAAMADLRAANAAEIKQLDEVLSQALAARKQKRLEIARALDKDLEDLESDLARKLQNEGVDPEHLKKLRQKVAEFEQMLASIRRDQTRVESWRHFLATEVPKLPRLRSEHASAARLHEDSLSKEGKLKAAWRSLEAGLKHKVTLAAAEIDAFTNDIRRIEERLSRYDLSLISPSKSSTRPLTEIISSLNEAEKHIRVSEKEIREGVIRVAKVFFAEPASPAAQHLNGRKAEFSSSVEGPEWVPALIEWFDTLHRQHRDSLMGDGRTITNNIKNGYNRLIALDAQIRHENNSLQANLNKNNVISVVQDLNVSITSSIKRLDFMPSMKRLSELHEAWMRSGQLEPPEGFTDAMTSLLTYWRGRDGIAANLRNQIKIEGYIIENGNRRDFHAKTDLSDISSNGVSYLILTTILVGFVNMVRGKAPVHVVWALDELGNIDAGNTRRLLDMLRENNITLIAATPSASASVNSLFDYRVKVIEGPRLAGIKGAGRPAQRLLASPEAESNAYGEI